MNLSTWVSACSSWWVTPSAWSSSAASPPTSSPPYQPQSLSTASESSSTSNRSTSQSQTLSIFRSDKNSIRFKQTHWGTNLMYFSLRWTRAGTLRPSPWCGATRATGPKSTAPRLPRAVTRSGRRSLSTVRTGTSLSSAQTITSSTSGSKRENYSRSLPRQQSRSLLVPGSPTTGTGSPVALWPISRFRWAPRIWCTRSARTCLS